MYKGYQEKLFTTNWGVNSGFQHLADKLNELLPFEGRCEKPLSDNKNLEKFRRAQNCGDRNIQTMAHVITKIAIGTYR